MKPSPTAYKNLVKKYATEWRTRHNRSGEAVAVAMGQDDEGYWHIEATIGIKVVCLWCAGGLVADGVERDARLTDENLPVFVSVCHICADRFDLKVKAIEIQMKKTLN